MKAFKRTVKLGARPIAFSWRFIHCPAPARAGHGAGHGLRRRIKNKNNNKKKEKQSRITAATIGDGSETRLAVAGPKSVRVGTHGSLQFKQCGPASRYYGATRYVQTIVNLSYRLLGPSPLKTENGRRQASVTPGKWLHSCNSPC